MTFDPTAYGPVVAALLERQSLSPLGPGKPAGAAPRDLSAETLFDNQTIVDNDMAECCRAGLLLSLDHLDASHTISQDVHTPSGSYWHAIMHRREPDYSNSKYWFRQVGEHPIYPSLGDQARRLAISGGDGNAAALADSADWDPFRFVDLCAEAARNGGSLEQLCREVAQAEWRLLFDFCYRQAVGR